MTARTADVEPQPTATRPRARTVWWVLLGAALCAALWLLSLPDVDLGEVGGLGLLSALPITWYVALAGIVALYLATLLRRAAPGWEPAALHVVLVAILYGTTVAIYDVPRFPYLYKHVGATEFLIANGGVDRSVDIYNNFPGFFYLTAGISQVTGIDVLDLAHGWQPVFALLFAGAVYWALGGLTTSRRVRYGAALLFTLCDWVQQNYFAPQSLAYVLSLLVIGGLLRSVPAGTAGLRWKRLARAGERRAEMPGDVPAPSRFWRSRWGALVLTLLFAAIAVSHQMSPVIVIVQSVVIAVLLRPAHPWLPVVFVLVEIAWLAQAWTFLNANFDLFSFGGADNIAPPTVDTSDALPGQAVVLWAAPLLMLTVGLLAGISVLLGILRMEASRVLVPALIGGVPLGLILGQPYGQEAIFRLYLFGLPWAVLLIARWLFADRVRSRVRRGVAAVLAAFVMAGLLPPALYGSELIAWQSTSDVAIGRWFERSTPGGSVLISLTPSFPLRSTESYVAHLYAGDGDNPDSLAARPAFPDAADDPDELLEVARTACFIGTDDTPVHIAVGPSSQRFLSLYGLMSAEEYDDFVAALEASPDFTLEQQVDNSLVFRCADLEQLVD